MKIDYERAALPRPKVADEEHAKSFRVAFVATSKEIRMDETPNAKASKNAKRDTNKAVDKVIDDKKKEPMGTKEAEEKVADDLMDVARKATTR